MALKTYKDLVVWQKLMDLVLEIYSLTTEFPRHERYGLVSQMRRCAVSIPSNIAEGYKRKGIGEYLHFLSIADGSAAELETQMLIAKKLYFMTSFQNASGLLEEAQKMLCSMQKKLSFEQE